MSRRLEDASSPSLPKRSPDGDAVSVTPSEQSASTSPGCRPTASFAERLVRFPPDRRARRLEEPHRAVGADDHRRRMAGTRIGERLLQWLYAAHATVANRLASIVPAVSVFELASILAGS